MSIIHSYDPVAYIGVLLTLYGQFISLNHSLSHTRSFQHSWLFQALWRHSLLRNCQLHLHSTIFMLGREYPHCNTQYIYYTCNKTQYDKWTYYSEDDTSNHDQQFICLTRGDIHGYSCNVTTKMRCGKCFVRIRPVRVDDMKSQIH
jgi:hypothetical protein